MSYRVIGKKEFVGFLEKLSADYLVVGPHEKAPGQFVFEPMTSFEGIDDTFVATILPPKKFFFPPQETLLKFDLSESVPKMEVVVEKRPLAIVGVHPCDMHGLQRLDRVFEDDNPDPYYLEKRKEAVIIGFNCHPDDQCFCASMGTIKPPPGGFDLFLTVVGDKYAVEIGSPKGEELLDRHAVTETITAADVVLVDHFYEEKQVQKLKIKIEVDHLPLLFDGEYHNAIWEELGKKCLSCGACNLVCPTCYCFDVQDEVEMGNLNKGERKRIWDGCQLEDFASVAGGENFRHHREDRNRHRFYRKFLYPVVKYRKSFCMGCGRCVRSSLVHISVVDTVNHFVEKTLKGGAR